MEDKAAFWSPVPPFAAGLSRRELFAALIFQGLCSNPDLTTAHNLHGEAVARADLLIAKLESKYVDEADA